MSVQVLSPVVESVDITYEQAILETLAYSDVFDFPLRIDELYRYLPIRTTRATLQAALQAASGTVSTSGDFYFLAGREHSVVTRRRRELISRDSLGPAVRIGRLLGKLPFIRMVALTGSLAVMDSDVDADLDYLLVAAPGRVWTARGFAVLLGRLVALFGFNLCPNVLISDGTLVWNQRDMYSAREICQMIPITGEEIYSRFRLANTWTDDYLPNAQGAPARARVSGASRGFWKAVAERFLKGGLGDRLEAWEMNRKIRRFTHQAGYGSETRFTADLCQGNFDHHGRQTRQAWRQRMVELGIDPPSSSEGS